MSKLIKYIQDNNLSDKRFFGKVLWYTNGRGIVSLEDNGSELYVDRSVIEDRADLKSGERVSFRFNVEISEVACIMDVERVGTT